MSTAVSEVAKELNPTREDFAALLSETLSTEDAFEGSVVKGKITAIEKDLAVIATLFMACAILRLARFNVENTPDPASHKRFKGLPSPGAAGCLATLGILRGGLDSTWALLDPARVHAFVKVWAPLGALLVALLMVSRIPYPHVTKQILRGRRHFRHLVQVLLLVCLLVVTHEFALFLLFWGYALGMPLRYLWLRTLHRATTPPATGLDEGATHS